MELCVLARKSKQDTQYRYYTQSNREAPLPLALNCKIVNYPHEQHLENRH